MVTPHRTSLIFVSGVMLLACATTPAQPVVDVEGVIHHAIDQEAAMFTALPRPKAVEAAKELASRDFAAGRFRYLISTPKLLWSEARRHYLKDRYGVEIHFLSMRQPEKALAVAEAYDSTMAGLLKQKFQRDIFKEAKEATEDRW
jgi:hypothetical protein